MDVVVAAVLILFFLVGIAVGIVMVIALSARRAHGLRRPGGPRGDEPGEPGPQWPDPDPYGSVPEDRAPWS